MYQKYISPHKGFQCAHVYLYHEASCSEEVISIIRENGIIHSSSKINNRFKACRDAYLLSSKEVNKRKRSRRDVDCCNGDIGGCISSKESCSFPDFPCDCSVL